MLICFSRFEVMSDCVGEAQNLLHWTIGLWCTYVYVFVGVVSMLMYHLMSVGAHLIKYQDHVSADGKDQAGFLSE
jgi:hypothetical protein